MAKPQNSIGHWTPAELQAFMQNVVRLEPSAFPPAFNLESLSAGQVNVTEGLDFGSNSRLTKDGKDFAAIQFPGASFDGSIEAMYAEVTGTALWRASGGTILAQVGDLPDYGDQYDAVNQRMQGSALYLPARTPVSKIHYYVSSAPSAFSGHTNKVGLFAPQSDGSLSEVGIVSGAGSDFTTAGFKTETFDAPKLLDAGVYVAAVLTYWNSITGTLGFACRNATRANQTSGYLGGIGRVWYQTGQTDMPSSWTTAGPHLARVWFGLS